MQLIVLGFLFLTSFNVVASDLSEYCSDDPTGEIYSEVYDATVEDAFSVIGLDANKYTKIIASNEDLSLFELSEKYSTKHPEIAKALYLWELETCIDRGYEMMTGQI